MSTFQATSDLTQSRSAMSPRAIAPAIIGNVLEWYDFTVYAFVAGIIAKNFFPASNATSALLATFAAFGIGFLARPLGGIILGRVGDLRGRKSALLISIYLMTAGTLLIAVLPTYSTAGVLAPILLVVARLLQGFSAGGEYGGAVSFVVEWAPPRRRGMFGSFHPVAVAVGVLIGSGVSGAMASLVSPQDMIDWGWRIPFLLGCVLGPIGFFLRRTMEETPIYSQAKDSAPISATPMRFDARALAGGLQACGLCVLSSISYYVLVFYMPTWNQSFLHVTPSVSLQASSAGLVLFVVATPLFGYLSDIIGRRPVLLLSCVCNATIPYFCFRYLLSLQTVTLTDLIVVQCIYIILVSMIGGALTTALVEMFPTRTRSTWMSIGYALSVSVFGGFGPFACIWLIQKSGSPIAPIFYIMFGAVVSGIFTLLLKETAFDEL